MKGPMRYSKFGARKVKIGGVTYDSKAEYERWVELSALQKAGKISELTRQVRMPVTHNGYRICLLIVDFGYMKDGEHVLEDYKGYAKRGTPATDLFILKRRLLLALEGKKIVISGPGLKQLQWTKDELAMLEGEDEDAGVEV